MASKSTRSNQNCWVPTCNHQVGIKTMYPLHNVKSQFLKEVWLALAQKSVEDVDQKSIYFCEDHFQGNVKEFIINKKFFSLNNGDLIPNAHMPDKICRTCFAVMDLKGEFHLLSTHIQSKVPNILKTELLKCMVEILPAPLYQVFRYCFADLEFSLNPVSIVCKKCYVNIWLFFAFKKTANQIEDKLSEDLSPEIYGRKILCRTCTVEDCSNFFPLGKETELGKLLQNILVKDFPVHLVPLRVCLSCYNILQKLNNFYNEVMSTDKMTKKRELLNSSLNTLKTNVQYMISSTSDAEKQKNIETQNLTLARLMLHYGQALKSNIHNQENWIPISQKLQQEGITHNIPSLISTWKKLVKKAVEKSGNNKPLSQLEELVLRFENQGITRNSTDTPQSVDQLSKVVHFKTNINPGPSGVNEICATSSISKPQTISSPKSSDSQNKSPSKRRGRKKRSLPKSDALQNASNDSTPAFSFHEKQKLLQVVMALNRTRYNLFCDSSLDNKFLKEIKEILSQRGVVKNEGSIQKAWNEMKLQQLGIMEQIAVKKQMKANPNSSSVSRSNRNSNCFIETRTNQGNKIAIDPMTFAEAMRTEFKKTTLEERTEKNDFWSYLIEKVAENHYKNVSKQKLHYLWSKLRVSAKIHARDGKDPADILVWDILEEFKSHRSPQKGDKKSHLQKEFTKNSTVSTSNKVNAAKRSLEQSLCKNTASLAKKPLLDDDGPQYTSTPEAKGTKKSKVTTPNESPLTNGSIKHNIDPKTLLMRQFFTAIKDTYKKMDDSKFNFRIHRTILRTMYENGFNLLTKNEAIEMWNSLKSPSNRNTYEKELPELYPEISRFLLKIKTDREQFRSRQFSKTAIAKKKSAINHKFTSISSTHTADENNLPPLLDCNDEQIDETNKKDIKINLRKWTKPEKKLYFSLISNNIDKFGSNKFWNNIHKKFVAAGFERSLVAFRMFFRTTKKSLLSKDENDLSETEKQYINVIKKCSLSEEERSSILSNKSDTIASDDTLISPNQIKAEFVSNVPTDSSVIDLTTYNYVSLKDLQQSPSWNMPTLERNDQLHTEPEIENGDSSCVGEEFGNNASRMQYVSAKDLRGYI